MNTTNELVINFILGGIILSSITYLVKYVSSELAAIIWASPILLVPSIIILWNNNTANDNIIDFVKIAIPYIFITLLWMVLFILIFKKNIKHNYCIITSILFSSIIWGVIVCILYKINFTKLF